MSERKVLNKYYPPDFDPSAKLPRVKKKNKLSDVRIMAPFNMKCNTCGNYIGNATKFNAKKETIDNLTYNNLKIFRFYIKCPRCMGAIIFKTNLETKSYDVEQGATQNFMAAIIAERQAKEEAEAEDEEEKINPMKQLENRTRASRQQMEATDQLQNLKSIKHRQHKVDLDSLIESKHKEALEEATPDTRPEDDAIRLEAKEILKKKAVEEILSSSSVVRSEKLTSSKINTSKSSSSLTNLRKKIKIVPKDKRNDD